MSDKKDPIAEVQKKLIEFLVPFDKMPKDVKETTMEFISFRRELTKESDRGCALLAASHLEYMLEKALRKRLCGSKNHLDTLFNFNGPLGTFSGRILITYSIGLFSKNHLNDIQLIRKVRNEFGHSATVISFDDPKIKKLTDGLKLVANSKANNSRKRFISSVSFISGTLEAIFFMQEKISEQKEVDLETRQKSTDQFLETIGQILK
jgi:DNA-binding MltR family transcriptional regulator